MKKADPLEIFLASDYEEQFSLLTQPQVRLAVEQWMGRAAFDEFSSHSSGPRHLSAGPKNIVFVPGVMGSSLQSDGLGGIWWLDMLRARDRLNALQLDSKGTKEIDEDADVRPAAVDVCYVPFRKMVATSGAFGGSVPFPYDWRKAYVSSVNLLRDKILQTNVDYGKPVHLVGHSMGGQMIRAALMAHGGLLWPKIGKIVFIGTPHYGSPSIAGYLKNHLWGWDEIGVLSMFLSRETFRSMRGVLSLLPAPAGIYPGTRSGETHPCANFDLYDAAAWNLDLEASSTVQLQGILDEIKNFYVDLFQWHESLLQEHKDRMLMIAGVGQETLFRLEFTEGAWGLWKSTKKVTKNESCNSDRDGDGRVPLASARLEDVAIRYVEGEHGALPNIPVVAQEVLAWLLERDLRLPRTCADALGSHLSGDECSSVSSNLDGSNHRRGRFQELSEYGNATPEFRKQVEADIDAGKWPQINLVKIF